ncbi:ATP-dependent DNA helicase [soil metagenome]
MPEDATTTATATTATTAASTAGTVQDVLRAAVTALGGSERPGQVQMAGAVTAALRDREHLLVQAGTGTGKSLGYLVPALLHHRPVVVATATLALQHQLVQRDLPALVAGASAELGDGGDGVLPDGRVPYAVLKGRSNFACLHRVREGAPDDTGALIEVPAGTLGGEVAALRDWAERQAEATGPGDRDAAPPHTDRAWAQVSVHARECLGAQRCPYAGECFAERARDRAMQSQVVVTNHALLAIDAIDGVPMLPEHGAVVVDEAHELVSRVTQASTRELSGAMGDRAARRVRAGARVADSDDAVQAAADLADAGDALRELVGELSGGRIDQPPEDLVDALTAVREAARASLSALGKPAGGEAADGDAARQQARAAADEVRSVAERMAAASDRDVLWVTERDRTRGGNELRIAPLDVSLSLRERLFGRTTVVLTSATLQLGGGFEPLAASVGLRPDERLDHDDEPPSTGDVAAAADTPVSNTTPAAGSGRAAGEPAGETTGETAGEAAGDESDLPWVDAVEPVPWRALDVGSPFDYRRQAILYVARHLPAPGRDGLGGSQLDEITDLVAAAGGRTLGLFSSRRGARTAAEHVRERLADLEIWCQGDAQLSELTRRFVDEERSCLFGTLSLWQGMDLPGPTCQLVLIDRVPFPRPDDPLMGARQRAVERHGGNGFMAVAATHAALLLAQGSGRLVRRNDDRGVVAVLDPRLVTARYGSFLAASLPPMWRTTDRALVLDSLRRIAAR